MVQRSYTTTADVLISFQQNPGATDGVEIINAGTATVSSKDGQQQVRPQGKGYYGLKILPPAVPIMNLFGSQYEVHELAQNTAAPAAGVGNIPIASWDDIWDHLGQTNRKVQHCLQLLGYYRGPIDGILARQTEEALLAFQADNNLTVDGLRWLRADGQGDVVAPNANAVDKIVSVVNSKNKINKQSGGAVYLIRKSLLRFTRAPKANPNEHFGPAVLGAPDVDDRGFGRAEANGHKCRGPVTSYSFDRADGADNGFRVKVIRDGISNAADLTAESEKPNYVTIINPKIGGRKYNLDNQTYMILKMQAGDPGRKSRKVKVYIKWLKPDDSLITIATLRVIIMPLKTLLLRPYRVRISQDGAAAAVVVPPNEMPHLAEAQLNAAIKRANIIWRPYGIRFQPCAWKSGYSVMLSEAGKVKIGIGVNECGNIIPPNYERDKINVYVVRTINGLNIGPYGVARSPIRFRNKPGIVLESRQEGAERTGDTLAHELGHYLGLANNFNNSRLSHAEDDPDAPIDDNQKRRDIWRIRRLMLGTAPSRLTNHGWAHHVGYGDAANTLDINGKMLSLRNLTGDKTDNECQNARKRSRHRKVYHA